MKKLAVRILVPVFVCLAAVLLVFAIREKDSATQAAGSEDGVFCGDYWVPEGAVVGSQESSASSSPTGETEALQGMEDFSAIAAEMTVSGVTYVSFDPGQVQYTRDVCLGSATDFPGTYQRLYPDIAAKVYTVKEDARVLTVEFYDGSTVTLKSSSN